MSFDSTILDAFFFQKYIYIYVLRWNIISSTARNRIQSNAHDGVCVLVRPPLPPFYRIKNTKGRALSLSVSLSVERKTAIQNGSGHSPRCLARRNSFDSAHIVFVIKYHSPDERKNKSQDT